MESTFISRMVSTTRRVSEEMAGRCARDGDWRAHLDAIISAANAHHGSFQNRMAQVAEAHRRADALKVSPYAARARAMEALAHETAEVQGKTDAVKQAVAQVPNASLRGLLQNVGRNIERAGHGSFLVKRSVCFLDPFSFHIG